MDAVAIKESKYSEAVCMINIWYFCDTSTSSISNLVIYCEICFPEYSTIHSSMCHPAKCRFQTPVSAFLDVECAEPDHFLHLQSNLPSLPGIILRRDTHPLPPKNVSPISVLLPAVPTYRPSSLPLIPRCPRRPSGMHARPSFWYAVSHYPPWSNPANQRYKLAAVTRASSKVV